MAWGEPLAASAAVLKAARPAPFKAALPRLLLPSKKPTLPVGVPPLPLTAALKVIVLPASAGLAEELNTTVVAVGALAIPPAIPLV